MVDFVQLQKIMKAHLEIDRNTRTVDTAGATLEDAVASAATLLGLPVRRLEYELIERGSPGFLGTGKKEWKIHAYEKAGLKRDIVVEDEAEEEAINRIIIEDKDGEAIVHLSYDGVFLKVKPPVGNGRRATDGMAMDALKARHAKSIDVDTVKTAVSEASGKYVKAGDFDRNPVNDTMVTVDISSIEMRATIFVTPPGIGGCDISAETYLSVLRNNKVVYGIDEEAVREFADKPIYKEHVAVAEGKKTEDGRDAYIQYHFERDSTKVKLKEGANGKVDFKDLNIIQNVVEGQPLAYKVDAEHGVSGRTVTGKIIPAKNGKDIIMPLGRNVHLSDDEKTIIADINGQVVEIGGKINVEPVFNVDGNVNLKTGNIIFLGTVIISGNVEDGFSVKAAGNIEVNGTVEKAELDAEGDIIVHQGVTGKGSGILKAGRSIWARFIENSIVQAGNMVIVSDGIVNSQVDANKRIVCQGKRAHIVGGRLRASEEINAKVFGSPMGGAETICEVGYDPREKEKLDSLMMSKADAEKQLEETQLNLQTLINAKKQRKTLNAEKEAYLNELMDKRTALIEEISNINKKMEEIQNYLNSLKTRGRVSASSKVYPGVKVIIRDIKEEVRNDYKAVTFVLEDGLVRVTKYEEPDEDAKRGPDGYTTN